MRHILIALLLLSSVGCAKRCEVMKGKYPPKEDVTNVKNMTAFNLHDKEHEVYTQFVVCHY